MNFDESTPEGEICGSGKTRDIDDDKRPTQLVLVTPTNGFVFIVADKVCTILGRDWIQCDSMELAIYIYIFMCVYVCESGDVLKVFKTSLW